MLIDIQVESRDCQMGDRCWHHTHFHGLVGRWLPPREAAHQEGPEAIALSHGTYVHRSFEPSLTCPSSYSLASSERRGCPRTTFRFTDRIPKGMEWTAIALLHRFTTPIIRCLQAMCLHRAATRAIRQRSGSLLHRVRLPVDHQAIRRRVYRQVPRRVGLRSSCRRFLRLACLRCPRS